MKRDPKILLLDVLESIEKIEKYLKRVDKSTFLKDTEKQDSVIKRLEVIGEAVKNVPVSVKKKNPEIPWKEIAGMRDKLIHEYFGIGLDKVWITAKKDLPSFKDQIKQILEEIK